MPRLRWIHAFLLLALLEVVVILLSLELHRQTFRNVGRLAETTTRFKERDRWFDRAEQCVLEINAPGNEIFGTGDLVEGRNALRQAQRKLEPLFESARAFNLKTDELSRTVGLMGEAADDVFRYVEQSRVADSSIEDQRQFLGKATLAMSRMDALQMQAMREISVIKERGGADLKDLMDGFEADLQSRIIYERYFIASFILLLAGILWFAYRLQRTNQALEVERKRVEEERRERLAAIGELCSSVAHGIRNPLAAIRSSAQLTLELGQLDENSQNRLKDILSEGARLGDRVTGLLGMARANKTGFSVVNLQEIVSAAARGLLPEFDRLGTPLRMEFDEAKIHVLGDRRHLEQAVIELLSNAMEHGPAGAPIELHVRRMSQNGFAEISVQDGGPGVPDEVRARIFDLFFTTKESGTGIGLATVKRIARLHGGDVTIAHGDAGRGARFVVTIPTVISDDSRA